MSIRATRETIENAEDIGRSAVMVACALDDSCAEPIHMHRITIK